MPNNFIYLLSIAVEVPIARPVSFDMNAIEGYNTVNRYLHSHRVRTTRGGIKPHCVARPF